MTIEKIEGCIGCRECVQACPTDVIRFDTVNKRAFIAWPEDCQLCHLCSMSCPVGAITIAPEKSLPVIVSWG